MTGVQSAGSLKNLKTFLQMQLHRLYAIIDACTVLVSRQHKTFLIARQGMGNAALQDEPLGLTEQDPLVIV